MFLLRIVVAYLFLVIKVADAANIMLIHLQVHSHCMVAFSIGKPLVDKGHSVYSVLPESAEDLAKEAMSNGIKVLTYKDASRNISISDITKLLFEGTLKSGKLEQNNAVLSGLVLNECKIMMDDSTFLKKVESLNIDLAFVDGTIILPCKSILPAKYGIPYISVDATPYIARVPSLPSFAPMVYVTPFADKMKFWERLINTFLYTFLQAHYVFPSWHNLTLIQEHIKDNDGMTWMTLLLNSEMFFSTTDSVLEYPEPSMPHYILIGCITCRPSKALPEDLEYFYEQATHGVIVASLGSMLSGTPERYAGIMVDAFKRIKYHVIWKFMGDTVPENISDNVKLMSWIPQNDLLAHKKTVLFITHCGNKGQYESVYNGVPMIGMPVYGDHFHNAKRVTRRKLGVELDMFAFTADQLVDAIDTVLGDKEYGDNARRMSAILRDAPMTPQETVVYWTEHVLQFGGRHLRSHALDMPLYQLYLLDVLAFFIAVLLLIVLLLYCSCVYCLRLFATKQVKEKSA